MRKKWLHKLIRISGKAGEKLLIFSIVFTLLFSGWPAAVFHIDLLKTPKAEASGVGGDIAIYREAVGTDSITTANFDHDWDTTVTESSTSFNLNVDNTQIELQSGHYAVMYGTRLDSTGGVKRSEFQTQLQLNGASLPIGWSQGFMSRTSGANEVITAGGGIIDVATDDHALVLRTFRTDVNSKALAQRAAGASGISLLKLDDTWDYLRLSRSTTQTGPTGATWVDVQYNRQDEYDTGAFTHSTTTNPNNITLDTAGHYLVFANTYGAITTADQTLVRQRLTLDGAQIDGTLTTVLNHGDVNGNSTMEGAASIGTIIETTSANQVLNVEVNRADGIVAWTINSNDAGSYVDRTAITIVKLPDDADYIRLDDSGTDDVNPASLTALGWNTEDEIDTDSFTHSTTTNDSRVTVDEDGDYLFFSNNYAAASGIANAVFNQGWTKNGGTLLSYGQTGQFNNSAGADDAGDWSGVIFHSMLANDYVEVESQQLGATGVMADDVKGIQGVNIGSLFPSIVTVSSVGNQQDIVISTTDAYIGGTFSIVDDTASRNVTSITITASGTVDAQSDLDNIELWYDLDTTTPFNCVSENYADGATQFGLTDTDGFSSAVNGTSTFTDSIGINATTTLCIYTVLDVLSSATEGETLDIQINDPATDVEVSEGDVLPASLVSIPDITTLLDDDLRQIRYHWRNDDNTETLATSATGGIQDTPFTDAREEEAIRLRLEVSNEGSATSSAMNYRLEYGEKITSCSDIGTWYDVGAVGGDWDMSDSTFLTEGTNTTNIATTTGGVTDENTTFLLSNSGVKDTTSQTGNITLTESEFVELEYSIEATSLAVNETDYCFRVTDAGSTSSLAYSVYPEATFQVHLEVSATGTQATGADVPTTGLYTGGVFMIQDLGLGDTHSITDITITETGTVDAQNDLDNIELWYDLDTTAPYNCASETYEDGATQFGSTDTDGFSSANGVSSFSGSVQASSTQTICFYPVLDVLSTASNNETLDLQITSPSTDVTASEGEAVRPGASVLLPDTTTLRDDVLTQIHYHFRNDDNTEALATSATGGNEDSPLLAIAKEVPKRIRLEVSNEGATSSSPVQYRLEYGEKITSCSAIGTWTDVGAIGGDWDMSDSGNLTEGNNTTNIATSTGGVTDENTTFLLSNSGVKDTTSQTGNITLTESEFVELEYSIVASSSAIDGVTYCLRLTDAGSTSTLSYSAYPEMTISPDVTVSATGTQVTDLDISSVDNYIGGTFVFVDGTGSRNITSITITETGTVDAQNDLDNIELWYDLDTTAPYNCASETYEDGATQFGFTDTDGFSSANGVSTFSDVVGISTTTTMCVYPILDILSTASNSESLNIQITNPSTEIEVSDGVVVPAAPVVISGSTNLREAVLTQIHYHWRSDDNTEALATSVTSGSEDTAHTTLGRGVTARIRLEVSNEGATSSSPVQYRLEYGEKITSCSAIGTWTDVGAIGGDWDMSDSTHLTEGNNTTNIATSTGGVTDENTTFLLSNSGVKDTTSQTGNITLTESEFVELEYSIVASSSATAGGDYCFRLTDAGSTSTLSYNIYPETSLISDVTVSATGTQTAFVDIPKANFYVGGSFMIVDDVSTHNVTNITITASGTVDAQNDIDNIKLYYDLDTTAPYNCAGETYEDGATQFGVTDTDGFSSATGTASFVDFVAIATSSTVCVYTVLDVLSGASNGEVFDIEIADPSTDVVLDVGAVTPTTTVAISGITTLRDDVLTQVHYHWRDDLGTETTAGSLTGGNEDTVIENVTKNDIYRLRLEVSNEGATSSAATQFRLEYGKKITSCSAIGTWADVGDVGGDFDMIDSANLTEATSTTNIATSTGGVTDENTTFLTPNGGVKDTSSQTGNITLTESEFVEMEFSISATDLSDWNTTYCFRTTDVGSAIKSYSVYPELTIRENKDFKVSRGVSTITGTSLTIYEGTDYDLQTGSTTAFIRLTNTQLTGAGNNTGGGAQNSDDVTVYISDPNNIETSVTFVRHGAADNTRVAWEIVEYIGPLGGDNELRVRGQSTTTYVSANLFATSTTVSGVTNDDDVVVFITAQSNADTGKRDYNRGISIASWNGTSSAAVFERGESADVSIVSWAVVEFIGKNWKIQRVPHTYTAAGSTETETITTVNDTGRTFVHVQKMAGNGSLNVADMGHEIWFSGAAELSFILDSNAITPSGHTSVAWVIENTQTTGVPMVVTRSSGTRPAAGVAPEAVNVNVGKTLSDLSIASIFMNDRSTGLNTDHPQAILAVRLVSASQYEIWRSDVAEAQSYRTEVIEWPTAERTISQNYYRFYVDNDALDPTDPWPVGATDLGEITSITSNDEPPQAGDLVRIRMSLAVSGATLPANAKTYKLQYGLRITTCSALSSEWEDLAFIGSTTAVWRGFNGTTTADETNLSGNPPTGGDLNLSVSDRAGTYEEENNTKINPFTVAAGEDVEYDWLIQRNGGVDKGTYCFRMVESDGVPLDAYTYYPTITTAGYSVESQNWHWYDDEQNITPTTWLSDADECVAPTDVDFENAIKLRITLQEAAGATGADQKFKLQYSTQSDFSSDINDVVEIVDCTATSTWCYYDGAGVDNAKIASSTLSDADSCVAGVGDGCGTHNESGTSSSSYLHPAGAAAEHEFTIQHAGAEENVTYYFRAYDVTNDEDVALGSGEVYPSLSTKGASLSFTIMGLPSNTTTEGIVTDVTTHATSVPFGDLTVDTDINAAQRLIVTTNAPKGYQTFMYGRQEFLSSQSEIEAITSTNETPAGWSTACSGVAKSCFGYHSGDDTLEGGSGRFASDLLYARMGTSSEEVAYSSFPVNNDIVDMVYRVRISENQEAGFYEHGIVYIVVPRF